MLTLALQASLWRDFSQGGGVIWLLPATGARPQPWLKKKKKYQQILAYPKKISANFMLPKNKYQDFSVTQKYQQKKKLFKLIYP